MRPRARARERRAGLQGSQAGAACRFPAPISSLREAKISAKTTVVVEDRFAIRIREIAEPKKRVER
jgi:hypothetical protein